MGKITLDVLATKFDFMLDEIKEVKEVGKATQAEVQKQSQILVEHNGKIKTNSEKLAWMEKVQENCQNGLRAEIATYLKSNKKSSLFGSIFKIGGIFK